MEAKTDPRTLQAGDSETINLTEVNGLIVYGGVDKKFNALRVFPPFEMNYPDMIKNKGNFYELIGLPHLKEKYDL